MIISDGQPLQELAELVIEELGSDRVQGSDPGILDTGRYNNLLAHRLLVTVAQPNGPECEIPLLFFLRPGSTQIFWHAAPYCDDLYNHLIPMAVQEALEKLGRVGREIRSTRDMMAGRFGGIFMATGCDA